MKPLVLLPLMFSLFGLVSNTALAEDALSKIGRAAQQTSQAVQEAKDTRDVITGQKTTATPATNETKQGEARKVVRDESQHHTDKVTSTAEAKRHEMENRGQEISEEKHRRNADRKAKNERKKDKKRKHDNEGGHANDHGQKDKRD